MSQGVFITGTDTAVGKTYVAAALLRELAQRGQRAAGMKAVASGCIERGSKEVWEDVEQLLAATNVTATAEDICPYRLRAPIAPHLAAAREGLTIDITNIVRCHERLAARADWVVIEGVGGWRVPLNAETSMADLARVLARPVVLVVGLRLGCINHALLSAEAILRDGAVLRGWVANVLDANMPALAGNIDALQRRLPVPLLAIFECGTRSDKAAAELAAALMS